MMLGRNITIVFGFYKITKCSNNHDLLQEGVGDR